MDTAIKKANKGMDCRAHKLFPRVARIHKRTAKRNRRNEDKLFIRAGVADSQDTRFIPIGGNTIYREEEVAALEIAKLYQDLLDMEVAEMRRERERAAMEYLGELAREDFEMDYWCDSFRN